VQKPENILIESLTTCKIKVIDYGNAYLHHDQRCSYVQSRAYRAPEVVLGLSYSTKVDMWSLGCILMELFTGKLLFDNKSVQSLLASHIALRGLFPDHMLQDGQLAHYYLDTTPGAPQCLVGKHEGKLCRMHPHVSSIANVLAHHGCNDAGFADFISELLQNDPVRRPSAKQALNHGWLQQSGSGTCTKYCLSSKDCGEAGQRLRSKYPSMNNLDSPSSIQSTTDYVDSDELIGPATPQSFREQCYLDRERGERKKVDNKWSRKSIGQRLSGSSLSAAVTHRTAPQLSSSKGESAAHIYTHSDLETRRSVLIGT
jgi:serine/threonine protein kinase